MGIALVLQQLRLQMARAGFQRRFQLEEQEVQTRELLDRVAVLRRERLNRLESLAGFLRHELENQMGAMSTSLDLPECGPKGTELERCSNCARRSLSRMNCLV